MGGGGGDGKMSEIDEHVSRRFDVRRRLGKGAYGIVWKAVDRRTKRVVAIKKIFDAFRDPIDSQRTFREIMFLQAFNSHPNIIQLFSVHKASNNLDIYLGFEYMETDLHNVIKRQNILKEIHVRYIMYQLFKAIKFIHSGDVIHRDLKPSNILLNTACHCKIADFGMARSVAQTKAAGDAADDPRLTDYVATRWYRAPEILIGNTRYTKGIDMWSLGCIFGEMLLQKPLFPGTSTFNQIEKILCILPGPTAQDIDSVTCGFGSNLLKNPPRKTPLTLSQLLTTAAYDALDLIEKLLVFNPNRRLTAIECLEHPYVDKFHKIENEPSLRYSIEPPFSDDVQFTIDDYRNKLYEIMHTNDWPRTHNRRESIDQSNTGSSPAKDSITPKIVPKPVAPKSKYVTETIRKSDVKTRQLPNDVDQLNYLKYAAATKLSQKYGNIPANKVNPLNRAYLLRAMDDAFAKHSCMSTGVNSDSKIAYKSRNLCEACVLLKDAAKLTSDAASGSTSKNSSATSQTLPPVTASESRVKVRSLEKKYALQKGTDEAAFLPRDTNLRKVRKLLRKADECLANGARCNDYLSRVGGRNQLNQIGCGRVTAADFKVTIR